jgi:tetratricopeptide (TPR) repeat protein
LALRALCIQHLQSGKEDDAEARAEALKLAHAALAASSDDWEAATLAPTVISSMGGSIETALSASQRALMLNPNGCLALVHNGWIQCIAGNPAAAIDPFKRSLRLSPRDPFRGFGEAGLALAYRDLGQPQEALIWAQQAIMSLPLLASGYRTSAVALINLGRIDEARECVAQLLKGRGQAPRQVVRDNGGERARRHRGATQPCSARAQLLRSPQLVEDRQREQRHRTWIYWRELRWLMPFVAEKAADVTIADAMN